MKYFGILSVAFVMMSFILLQDRDIAASDVPRSVMEAFNTTFPDASDVEWEKKGKEFEADFEIKNIDYSARFSAQGKLVMQKNDILVLDMPNAVSNAIEKEYNGYHIDDVEKIEMDGKEYFQVELDGKMRDRKVVYTADGNKANKVKYWD